MNKFERAVPWLVPIGVFAIVIFGIVFPLMFSVVSDLNNVPNQSQTTTETQPVKNETLSEK